MMFHNVLNKYENIGKFKTVKSIVEQRKVCSLFELIGLYFLSKISHVCGIILYLIGYVFKYRLQYVGTYSQNYKINNWDTNEKQEHII